ncbi:MAG TPA: transglycosylase SLT domain-containing protein, partial [Polyangia bacterium]|nr:transglycosylase SLT domain-containing protein [Polyangia bacterium]
MLALGGAGAHASPGDDDGDREDAPSPTRTNAKPVAFERAWLDPFFQKGPAKQAVERFRAEDWSGAEAGFARALKSLRGEERLAATDMLALSRLNEGDWAGAGRLFEELFTSYARLAPYHAYNAARCRLRRGDWAGALEWAAKVPAGSVPQAEAALVRIDALRSLARWDEALAAVNDYLTRFPKGPRRAEALFKKAEATEKATPARPSSDVVAIYRRVWAEAPLEAWSDRAGERLEQIAAALPAPEAATVRSRTAGEMVTRGMVFFDHNRNQESETTLASALGAPGLTPDLECKARFYRAQSVWKARQRPRAAPLFDEADWACARAGNRDLHAKSLYQGARSWASAGNRDAAITRYQRVEAEHADHSYADDARIRMAELLTDAGDDSGAAKALAEVPTRYPKGDLLNEALWRLAFGAWRAGHLDDALHWLDENLRLVPHEDIWYAEGRVQYWKGRVFEKQGQADEAREWYQRAVKEYPLSVYALLSLARLRVTNRHAADALVASLRKGLKEIPAWSFPPRALYGEPGFLRAVELARMGQGSDARRELAKLGLATSAEKHATSAAAAAAASEGEEVIWITAVLLDRGGLWSASHTLPRYGLTNYRLEYPKGLNAAKWKLAYPRAFAAYITKNTRANQLPEALQLAIMREESAFSPKTESFANAIGLTQMLVKTARRFSDGAPVTRDVLLDPAKNLELGGRFLGYLWKHFDGTPPLAIAGYNAGEAAVDRWLGERGDLDMDEFMET